MNWFSTVSDFFINFFYTKGLTAGLIRLTFVFFRALLFPGRSPKYIYNRALSFSAILYIVSLYIWANYDSVNSFFPAEIYSPGDDRGRLENLSSMRFLDSRYNYYPRISVDGVSVLFLILRTLFLFLCVLSLNPNTPNVEEALRHLFLLTFAVLVSFSVTDLLGFFIFFEITLRPIFFLVLVWGSRERRVRASYLISIYRLFGSIFLFFAVLYMVSKYGRSNYFMLLDLLSSREESWFMWVLLFLAFATKIPVFPVHVWLPEAHVEAPRIGSVLLAAILLKLGRYGIIRFSLPLFPQGTRYFDGVVATLAVMGIIYTSLTAIRQIDLKKIIAYSSVGHMSVVVLGLMAGNRVALQGAVFQMLSHGIVSGALFFAVGVLYERYGVRSLKYYGGLAAFYPLLTVFFVMFSLANISFPMTSSFVGEFLIFVGVFAHSFWATFFAATSMVLGTIYSLWRVNRVFFGNVRDQSIHGRKDMSRKEIFIFAILTFYLLFLGVYPAPVQERLYSLQTIILLTNIF